jgi:hypothetical protein
VRPGTRWLALISLALAVVLSACGSGGKDVDAQVSEAYGYEVTGCVEWDGLMEVIAAEGLSENTTLYVCDDALGAGIDEETGEVSTFAGPFDARTPGDLEAEIDEQIAEQFGSGGSVECPDELAEPDSTVECEFTGSAGDTISLSVQIDSSRSITIDAAE